MYHEKSLLNRNFYIVIFPANSAMLFAIASHGGNHGEFVETEKHNASTPLQNNFWGFFLLEIVKIICCIILVQF